MSYVLWYHNSGGAKIKVREKFIGWRGRSSICKPKGDGGLGFRDFKLFNWELIGKQAWRLVTNTGSLLEQLLKARDYPGSSFWRPSWVRHQVTWRGIWEARWVVRRGMRWRVGNVKNVRVWHDPWIPGTQTRRVISPCGSSNRDMAVGALINPISKVWNPQLVSQLFLPFEQERILSIPLSNRLPEDFFCWDSERNGKYSVRSAYRALISDEWRGVEVTSSDSNKYGAKCGRLKCCLV